MSSTATRLSNQLLQENWASSSLETKPEAKISYLMVEQITPPEHLWEKIANRLETQHIVAQPLQATSTNSSSTKTIALLVSSAAVSIALILYWLI